ncbi:MAG: MFS transporter [Chloroflexota bacterium]
MDDLKALWRNPILRTIYIIVLLTTFWRGILSLILPLYATSFEVSYIQVGILLGAMDLGMLIGDLPASNVLNRLGQKKTLLLGVTIMLFPAVILVWAPQILIAVIFQFISGLGLALFNLANHLSISEAVKLTNRGKAIASLGGISRVGFLVGPALGGILGGAFGLRIPFLMAGLIGIILLYVISTSQLPEVELHQHNGQKHHIWSVFKKHRQILQAAGAGVLLAQTVRAGRRVIIPLFGSEILGLDVQAIGIIVSAAAAVDMVMFPISGYMMDNWGRKWSIVPSFFMQGLGMALVPFTSGYLSLMLVACFIGLANGLSSGTMMTLGADLSPEGGRGEFLATWRFIGDSGFAIAPNIVGLVADLFLLGTAVFVIAGAGVMAGAVFGLFVPETLKKEPNLMTAD